MTLSPVTPGTLSAEASPAIAKSGACRVERAAGIRGIRRLVGLQWHSVLGVLFCTGGLAACSDEGELGRAKPSATAVVSAAPSMLAAPPVPDLTSGLECADKNPVPSEGRLLTRFQFDNSVRDIFEGRIGSSFSAGFPAENEVVGFSNNAHATQATSWLVEAQMLAAEKVSTAVVEQLATLLPCAATLSGTPTDASAACLESFLNVYGERAFRRPLTGAEREPMRKIFAQGASGVQGASGQGAGFAKGIAWVVQALLQSPQFLYRFDAARDVAVGSGFALSDSELASRLSYFLWNSIPDEPLRRAAASAELHTTAQIEAHVRRMLKDPKAQATLLDFTDQWVGAKAFTSIVRESGETDTAYNAEWQTSLEQFVGYALLSDQGGLATLMKSPRVYMNAHLAGLYGVPVPAGTPSGAFFSAEFPGERYGLVTQPGLMALVAHADQTAPVQRGVFVRSKLLCQPPPDPPPSVNAKPPMPDPKLTTRQRFAVHTESKDCASCHRLIDGLGLPLDGFDQLGRHRTEENGLALDLSGEIYATREAAIRGEYNGPKELAERLSTSQQALECIVTQFYRYGSGRVEEKADLCSVAQAAAALRKPNATFTEMIVAMATSDAFRYRTEVAVTEDSEKTGGTP